MERVTTIAFVVKRRIAAEKKQDSASSAPPSGSATSSPKEGCAFITILKNLFNNKY